MILMQVKACKFALCISIFKQRSWLVFCLWTLYKQYNKNLFKKKVIFSVLLMLQKIVSGKASAWILAAWHKPISLVLSLELKWILKSKSLWNEIFVFLC